MRRLLWFLALAGVLLWLPACSDDVDVSEELNIERNGFTAYFDLTAGVLPFPNNLLFSGSTDGTLNIPVEDATNISDPKVAMNALDGFSTSAPISTTFSGAIDPATLTPATVRVFEVTLSGIGGAVTGITRELGFGQEFVATVSSVDPDGKTLVVLPTAPLGAQSSYLVVLTDGIKSAEGADPQVSAHYLIAKTPNSLIGTEAEALEPVRQLVNYQELALTAAGVDTDSVILSWTFTTQSVGNVLGVLQAATATGSATILGPLGTTQDIFALLGKESPGLATIYAGTLDVPYYLTAATHPQDTTPLGTWWRTAFPAFEGDTERNLTFLNPLPAVTSTETIPLLLSVPVSGSAPWPVVIFQHGITRDRTLMLAVADSLAAAGFAVVAIDMPLHGITDPDSPLYTSIERTFDIDLVDNATSAPGPDGAIDASGTHYINLASLLTSRDNIRQSVADLFALTDALETLDYDGGGADLDTSQIYFVGHSFGGITGVPFLALEPSVKSAVLGMVGGGYGKMFDASLTFSPILEGGLAANGILKGTADYESFIGALQTMVDSGDPINYTTAASANRGVLMYEILGDTRVPNNVMADAPPGTVPSPLAGTDPLAFFMGLQTYDATTSAGEGETLGALLRFTSGDHGSLLDPTADPVVTGVMQESMATFLATDGATLLISDPSVLE